MMKRAFRQAVAALLAVCILSLPTAARADLSTSLDAMINTTAPGVYSTRDRGALVGGSLTLRTPVRNVQLFYFDPPRLNAGCGGIDMYMGSFSFINADAFKGMLKAIAQAAAGYFFKLALNAICPPCEAILASLQDLATILNNNALNSCKIGRDLANWGMDAFKDIGKAFEGAAERMAAWVGDGGATVASGALDGWFSGFMKIFTDTKKIQQDTKNYTAESGNATWKAIVNSKSTEVFDAGGAGAQVMGEVELANTIISLIGTVIIAPQEDLRDQTGPPSPDPLRDAMCRDNPQSCEAGGHPYYPSISFENILKGSENGAAMMWRCRNKAGGGYETDLTNPHGCLDLTQEEFTFIGTEKFVNKWLFCNPSTVITAGIAPANACWLGGSSETDSIVGRLTSGQDLTSQQVSFINNFRHPVTRLILEVQRSREAAEMIAHTFAPYMATQMAINIGNLMVRVANKAFSKNTNTMMPAQVRTNLTAYAEWLSQASQETADLGRHVVQAAELAKAVRSTDAVVVAPSVKR